MKEHKLKNNTMNELELQRVYNYPIYPRDSKIYSDKVLLILIMDRKVVVTGLAL